MGGERLLGQDSTGLVAWCGGWPLLVRQAGAKLAMRPSQSVAEFADGLEDHALSVDLDGDPRSVDDALGAAYDLLSPDAARLFERLGLVAGDFCLHVAAVVAGTTEHRVRQLLDELLGVRLVVESGSGEFGFHDVVGRFARRLASAQEWTLVLPPGCPDCLLSRAAAPAGVARRRVPVPA